MGVERRWVVALLAGAVALVAGVACRMPAALTGGLFSHTEVRPDPAAQDCERCHQEVYREWQTSLHARAWSDEGFARASAEGRVEACAGCHAPGPVVAGGHPLPRQARREEGVTCVSCHLSPDPGAPPLTMRGPVSRTTPIEIHPMIEEDPLYRSSSLCGGCHRGTYAEWRAAPRPAGEPSTCQGCHMTAVHRKVESVHEEHAYSALFVALGEDQPLRRHGFAVEEASAEQIAVGADLVEEAGAPRIRVSVRNQLPHDLPTGEFGRRAVRVVARWPGGEDAAELDRRRGEALASGARWEPALPLPAGVDPARITVTLERWDPGTEAWRTLVGPFRPSREAAPGGAP